jgi:hypothetical protein
LERKMLKALRALDYPSPAIGYYMDYNVRHTPDASEIFQYKHMLLFVCDQHKSHMSCFPDTLKYGPTLMDGCADYPIVFTMQGFNMVYERSSGLVVPIHSEKTSFLPQAKIKGQLHKVRPDLIQDLDIRYQNGVQFKRRRIKLLLPYRAKLRGPWRTVDGKPLPRALQGWRQKEFAEKIHIVEAWMYIGRHKYWHDRMDGGFETLQCPIFFPNVEKSWLPRYYEYTKTFEEEQRSC